MVNKYFKLWGMIFFSCLSFELYSYGVGCQWYSDEFGPLQTGYTMGDLVRYTATPGLNVYSKMVVPPAGAIDIQKFGNNTYNLYNALGYLYAGWSLFNSSKFPDSSKWVTSFRQPKGGAREDFDNNQNCRNTIEFPVTPTYQVVKDAPIGTQYSKAQISSLWGYDENMKEGNDRSLKGLANFNPQGGDSTDSFASLFGHYASNDVIDNTSVAASASCGWCSNASDGDMMMYFVDPYLQKFEQLPILAGNAEGNLIAGGRVYPTGQFFGARIAHILGAVVNDVPGLSATSAGTGTFNSPLISGSQGQEKNGALPTVAVMQGNTPGWTITKTGSAVSSTAPAGMFQVSTAHFGSMQTFLSTVPKLTGNQFLSYNYLMNHIMPMVSRLSSLCSYRLSTNANTLNLIKIDADNISPYDNGVIVAIQNNTDDELEIYQNRSSAADQIGSLQTDNNNYFLHTASLMGNLAVQSSEQAVSSVQPDATQMISIIDRSEGMMGTYIQLLSSVQLQQLVSAVNTKLNSLVIDGQSLPNLTYDQIIPSYTVPADVTPAYLVVTNFDPILDSSNNLNFSKLPTDTNQQAVILNSYRIQAVNVAEFGNKPYLCTMQINKESVGYGVKTNYAQDSSGTYKQNKHGGYVIDYSMSFGNADAYMLYPSILSVQVCTWQNYLHTKLQEGLNYSMMPLMMLPQDVVNANIVGLESYYMIWLMSYAAAMTECSYNGASFGNVLSIYDKVFNLFRSSNTKFTFDGSATCVNSRMVIDQQGVLRSGQVLELDNEISVCGCDTWDSGGGFNQDISMVNIVKNGTDQYGNPIPVANKVGADYINLMVTFKEKKVPTNLLSDMVTFDQAYGLPYNNILFCSIPTQALTDGVTLEISKLKDGSYQMIITSKKNFVDPNNNSIQAGSVLAVLKPNIDMNLDTVADVTIDFMHASGDVLWSNPQLLSLPQEQVSAHYPLRYVSSKNKNNLILGSKLRKKSTLVEKSSTTKVKASGVKPLQNQKNMTLPSSLPTTGKKQPLLDAKNPTMSTTNKKTVVGTDTLLKGSLKNK